MLMKTVFHKLTEIHTWLSKQSNMPKQTFYMVSHY